MRTERAMRIQVVSRSGKDVVKGGVEVPEEGTVADLKRAIHKRIRKFYPERQRITLPQESGQARPVVLDGAKRLKDCFTTDNPQVVFKDLGPQVYTYFGLPARTTTHPVQTYALFAWCFHYAKREFETFFIHRFSHATSPLANVYRNCLYYWAFGAFIAYFVNHPFYTPVNKEQMYVGFAISIISQLSNFYCHIILKNLRSPDGKGGYQIPSGFLFNYVTCANYTTEILQWVGFNLATQTIAGYLFAAAASYIMTVWALQKHKRLRKIFDGQDGRVKYPKRWVILPPLL